MGMRASRPGLALVLGAVLLSGCAATGAAPAGGGASSSPSSFSVTLAADPAPPLRIGQAVSLRLSAAAPSYGALYHLRSDGGVAALAENIRLDPAARRFPPSEAGYVLRAAPPASLERLLLVGALRPIPPLGFAPQPSPLSPGFGHAAFAQDLERRMNASGAPWSRAELLLEIRP